MTIVFMLSALLAGDLPEDSPRVTPLVKLIRQVEPAVTALFCVEEKEGRINNGSGTIIHPDGFVLTNNHVVKLPSGFALLADGQRLKFHVIGRMPEKDLAVVRLEGAGPFTAIPVGRSDDVMIGEPVIAGGNPGGRGLTFTSGIISSRGFLAGGPNALVMTNYRNTQRDRFLQFDAAVNPGNSGGPLVNMEGDLVGLVSAGIKDEENIGLAIPIDTIRHFFEQIVDPEVHGGLLTGLQLDPLAESGMVTAVADASPAAAAGIQVGDSLIAVDGRPIRKSSDWWLLLHGRKPGDRLTVSRQRGEERLQLTVVLGEMPYEPAAMVENVRPGLTYQVFDGTFDGVPEFDEGTSVATGVAATASLDAIPELHGRINNFGVRMTGYLRIARDGVYRVGTFSDDGSFLHLNGRMLVDNGGHHPPKPMARAVRLAKGLHEIQIDYYQGTGGRGLNLTIEQQSGTRPVEPGMLFHSASAPSEEDTSPTAGQ